MVGMETVSRAQTAGTVQTTDVEPAFVDVLELVALLGRSKEYFYAGLRRGQFPGVKFGRSWGVPRAFIDDFLTDVERGRLTSFEDYAATWMRENQWDPAAKDTGAAA